MRITVEFSQRQTRQQALRKAGINTAAFGHPTSSAKHRNRKAEARQGVTKHRHRIEA